MSSSAARVREFRLRVRRPLINGKSYGIGELELVSLEELRERVKSADGLSGRLKVRVVTGGVRQMHSRRECRRDVSSSAPVQPAGDDRAFEVIAGGRCHPLPIRPYSRPGVCDRSRRGYDLPQLLRTNRWQPWPDGKTPIRRVGQSRRGFGRGTE